MFRVEDNIQTQCGNTPKPPTAACSDAELARLRTEYQQKLSAAEALHAEYEQRLHAIDLSHISSKIDNIDFSSLAKQGDNAEVTLTEVAGVLYETQAAVSATQAALNTTQTTVNNIDDRLNELTEISEYLLAIREIREGKADTSETADDSVNAEDSDNPEDK